MSDASDPGSTSDPAPTGESESGPPGDPASASEPDPGGERDSASGVAPGDPLVEVEGLSKYFSAGEGLLAALRDTPDVQAVDDVSFEIRAGETLALVGESGCGKSTLARTVLQLERPTEGSVRFKGRELTDLSDRDLRPMREDVQMIFQDPQASLNPRMKVGPIVEEPMRAHGLYGEEGRRERARDLLEQVGLDASHYNRYPHEFSGGQRQRINLARALSVDPDLILCDEPVSALDVSIQAQVLNTMDDLQAEFGVTYLFISHDMSVVRYVADRVAVMYLGHVVELGDTEELFERPKHPYTRALLDAVPVPDPDASEVRGRLQGDVPSPIDPPSGCRFRTRCPELIQPGEYGAVDREALPEPVADAALDHYGFPDPVWRDLVALSRAIDRRTFSKAEAGHDPDSIEAYVLEEFFTGGAPEGEARDVIRTAVEHVADDEWTTASDLLTRTVEEPSICAVDRPAYVVDTDRGEHYAACHLHRDDPASRRR